MKENLFEMGVSFDDNWSSDNKDEPNKTASTEIKVPQKHQLHFAKEKRRGKVVTIVKPFYIDKKELQSLLKVLKKKLGTGGTLKDNSLEFQGDLPDKVRACLEVLDYRFK